MKADESLSLKSLQGWMQNALMFPRGADGEKTAKIVEPSPRLSAAARLGIYQRSYYLRLLKCMDEQFPALRHALGEELFKDFAREYLLALPSESYTLYKLGERFPTYLDETRPDKEKAEGERERWVDFMVDLAQCERDLFVMFDAPGHEGKPFADKLVPDDHLSLQPCFALHDYRFPVSWYYHQVREKKNPSIPPAERSCVALVRKEFITRTYPLADSHYRFLKNISAGVEIARALRTFADESGRSAEEVNAIWSGSSGLRSHWIEAGFFIAV